MPLGAPMNKAQFARLACAIQALERQGKRYIVNKNGSIKILYDEAPRGYTPRALTSMVQSVAHPYTRKKGKELGLLQEDILKAK